MKFPYYSDYTYVNVKLDEDKYNSVPVQSYNIENPEKINIANYHRHDMPDNLDFEETDEQNDDAI